MRQIRKIIELHRNGASKRETARIAGVSKNTAKDYLRAAAGSGIGLDSLLEMDDNALFAALKLNAKDVVRDPRHAALQVQTGRLLKELKKTGVTMQLLWEEYRAADPQGYGYTQFCRYLGEAKDRMDLRMHLDHKPGDMMMFDFAGEKLYYVNRATGELVACEVLVCVLPYSGLTYVEALASQRQIDVMAGLGHALRAFGGVPRSLKSDNMPAYVKKASRYEPAFTESMEYFADHYGTTLMASRAYKPKDKPHVENMVLNVYRRVYAPLRNDTFYSLAELNAAIRAKVAEHNAKAYQGMEISRNGLFEADERHLLGALPTKPYTHRHITHGKVQKDYHVVVGEDWHFYSVPYRLVGKQMKIVYCSDTVEIYDGHERVALHVRDSRKHKHSTDIAHRPSNHRHYAEQLGWDGDYFTNWAKRIGPSTLAAITHVLASKSFPEQTFRSCIGILRLGSNGQEQRLEAACKRLEGSPRINFQMINNILKNGLDKADTPPEKRNAPPAAHENLRGPNAYQ